MKVATHEFQIAGVTIGGRQPLVLIAGLCVIENLEHTMMIASRLKEIAQQLQLPFIFKGSYDKANRTSLTSYRGPGIEDALQIMTQVKEKLDIPILTDVHDERQVPRAAEVADVLQIPAFLCRQTDLVIAAARTQKAINIKKGQFLSPWDVKNIIDKITSTGNQRILLTERGTSFGYNNLVVDFRSFIIMRQLGYPVVYDATHSLQLPGGQGKATGGQAEFIPYLTRAATALGIDALFCEVHEEPTRAKSDAFNTLKLDELPALLRQVKTIDQLVKTGEW